MDLVQSTGVNVSDWSNMKNKNRSPASNPNYCNRWSFLQPGKVVVLNYWHDQIEEVEGKLHISSTIKKNIKNLQKEKKSQSRARRINSAQRMDRDIQTAYREKLPVRIIVLLGRKRGEELSTDKASEVKYRMLDLMTWTITSYNVKTGDAVFTRDSELRNIEDEGWSGTELKASLNAYTSILRKELKGQKTNKSEEYKKLSTRFKRSRKSYEYRMQNVSYVLSNMGLPWIQGLKPKSHIGSKMHKKLECIILEKAYFINLLKEPTDDLLKLITRSTYLPNYKGKKPPKGSKKPNKNKKITVIQENISRDPEIVKWIKDNSDGICECCNEPAPFNKIEGKPYLEVHHLKLLADGGSDTTFNAVAICPNCHREMHYGENREKLLEKTYKNVDRLKRE